MVGGFSDHLKRGLIDKMVKNLQRASSSANIIIVLNGEEDFISNPEQEGSLDVRVEQFAEGCFCCGLKYELSSVLSKLIAQRVPDLIIMTVSVITDLELVSELMREIGGDDLELVGIYSFDLKDANELIKAFPDMVNRNLISSSTVMLVDEYGQMEDIETRTISTIREINPKLVNRSNLDVQGMNVTVVSKNYAMEEGNILCKYILN
ncbi:MAG: hypothetical protein WC375_00665 [Methanomassiliicoccales archaeon]|jgi:G3E family GTPase